MVDRYMAVLIAFSVTISLAMAANRLLCPAEVHCPTNPLLCVSGGGSDCGDWGICCGSSGPTGTGCCVPKPKYIPGDNYVAVAPPNPAPQPEVSDGRNPQTEEKEAEAETTSNQPSEATTQTNGTTKDQSSTSQQLPEVTPEVVPEYSFGAGQPPPPESELPPETKLTTQSATGQLTTPSTKTPDLPILLPAIEPSASGAGRPPAVDDTLTTFINLTTTTTRTPIKYSGLSINNDDDDRRKRS